MRYVEHEARCGCGAHTAELQEVNCEMAPMAIANYNDGVLRTDVGKARQDDALHVRYANVITYSTFRVARELSGPPFTILVKEITERGRDCPRELQA